MRAWNRKRKPKFMAKAKWSYFPLEAIYFKTYITLSSSESKFYSCYYLNSFMVKKYSIGEKFGKCRTKNF